MTAGFIRREGWRGCFLIAVSSCVFTLAGASAAGEAPVSSDPLIQSVFESTVVRLNAKPDSQALPVEWAYTNHFDYPLLVERFDQSCGCLSGQVAPSGHESVPPGKTGKIRATFTPGNHRGVLSKSLYVGFVGHENPVELVVEMTIVSSVELSARELIWKFSEKPETRIIDVTSGTGASFTITGLLGVPEGLFTIANETIVPGKHYQLRITPNAATAEGTQCLQVRTDSKDSRDQVIAVFLITQPSPAATSSQASPITSTAVAQPVSP